MEDVLRREISKIWGGKVILMPGETPDRVDCLVRVPENLSPESRIIVAVHGISRRPLEQISLFAKWARERDVIVIAPFFHKKTWNGYQKLFCRYKSRRADIALINALENIRSWLDINQSKLLLFGYSGGGQFVHRFAMLHPEMVEAVALGAAGWYTTIDATLPFPFGMGEAKSNGFNIKIDPLAFTDIRFFVAVGEHDTEQDGSLNKNRKITRIQGKNRVERAGRWVETLASYMKDNNKAGNVKFSILQGIGHSFREFILDKDYSNHIDQFFFSQS